MSPRVIDTNYIKFYVSVFSLFLFCFSRYTYDNFNHILIIT